MKSWNKRIHGGNNGQRRIGFRMAIEIPSSSICAPIKGVCMVEDDGSQILTTPEDISRDFTDFYHQLFSSSNSSGVDECVEALKTQVSQDMNEQLTKEFTAEEVGFASLQMSPLKSPGPDGFSACF